MRLIKVQGTIIVVSLAVTLIFLLNENMESISQLLDGKGSELVFASGFILIYFCSAFLFIFDQKSAFTIVKQYVAVVIFLLVLLLNSSHFVLYLSSYWSQSLPLESLLIGIVLGVGICTSFAILFYFTLRYSDAFLYSKTARYFLLFFAIGQLMQSIVLLQQVDILPFRYFIWSSSHVIAENSEFGQLLRVLIGYETTPSFLQGITYLAAFIVPVLINLSISQGRCFVRQTYGDKL